MITLKLMKDEKTIIWLTDNTIKNAEVASIKTDEVSWIQSVHDVELYIEVENENLDELYAEASEEEAEGAPPREIDSVRLLLDYSLSRYDSEKCYLDGELSIVDGFTQSVSKFELKNLFVVKFEESFTRDMKNTSIYVRLRERV